MSILSRPTAMTRHAPPRPRLEKQVRETVVDHLSGTIAQRSGYSAECGRLQLAQILKSGPVTELKSHIPNLKLRPKRNWNDWFLAIRLTLDMSSNHGDTAIR